MNYTAVNGSEAPTPLGISGLYIKRNKVPHIRLTGPSLSNQVPRLWHNLTNIRGETTSWHPECG